MDLKQIFDIGAVLCGATGIFLIEYAAASMLDRWKYRRQHQSCGIECPYCGRTENLKNSD